MEEFVGWTARRPETEEPGNNRRGQPALEESRRVGPLELEGWGADGRRRGGAKAFYRVTTSVAVVGRLLSYA